MLEKEAFYGGTTALSGGVAWVPNNSLMAKAGIDGNPAEVITFGPKVKEQEICGGI